METEQCRNAAGPRWNPLLRWAPRASKAQPGAWTRGYPLLVHSHLAWDWVWQRPQQFLSRLSARHRVLFIEGPYPENGWAHSQAVLREAPGFPNITILRMGVPARRWQERDWLDAERRRLLQTTLGEHPALAQAFRRPVQWFYDPMAVTAFAGQADEIAIIYDCMDELSQFKGAPPELVKRERHLLAHADLVFAGGPKIYQAKSALHGNCHVFGCGVDEPHFGIARNGSAVVPRDIAHLQGPVLGFFGVVDERMDYNLLARVADAEPTWNLVIVGPRTKVEESVLPRRPNLHWLGGRDYARLPHYANRFNVCLMPFALNAATEFINPTKALEYMATGKPIVSTAVEDVVRQFSHIAAIADSTEAFISLCRKALEKPNLSRIQNGIELAKQHSWESIVAQLERHVDAVLEKKALLKTCHRLRVSNLRSGLKI